MNLFDRYLVVNYLIAFGILFVSTFGLFVVIDFFDNVDDFANAIPDGASVGILQRALRYYGFQAFFFLEMVGHILIVLSLIITLIIVQRRSELTPLLAAGIPLYRSLRPFILAVIVIDLVLVCNREFVIPQIAYHKHENRGQQENTSYLVQPAHDHSSGILIRGRELVLGQRTLHDAEFVLPAPGLTAELAVLQSKEAIYFPSTEDGERGWLLKNGQPPLDQLHLTARGREIVKGTQQPGDIFVVTPIDCAMLHNRGGGANLQPTIGLVDRVRNPAFGGLRSRKLIAEIHRRLLEPLLTVVCALIACIFLFRRETKGFALNVSLTLGCVGSIFGLQQLFGFLGDTSLVGASLAAWGPVIFGGVLVSWHAEAVQT